MISMVVVQGQAKWRWQSNSLSNTNTSTISLHLARMNASVSHHDSTLDPSNQVAVNVLGTLGAVSLTLSSLISSQFPRSFAHD